jgi:hypothetical protein
MIIFGTKMVMAGTMSLGMLVAFLAYRDQLLRVKKPDRHGFSATYVECSNRPPG